MNGIQFVENDHFGYSVFFNGEVILECLAKDELEALTIGEIIKLALNVGAKFNYQNDFEEGVNENEI